MCTASIQSARRDTRGRPNPTGKQEIEVEERMLEASGCISMANEEGWPDVCLDWCGRLGIGVLDEAGDELQAPEQGRSSSLSVREKSTKGGGGDARPSGIDGSGAVALERGGKCVGGEGVLGEGSTCGGHLLLDSVAWLRGEAGTARVRHQVDANGVAAGRCGARQSRRGWWGRWGVGVGRGREACGGDRGEWGRRWRWGGVGIWQGRSPSGGVLGRCGEEAEWEGG